MIKRSFHIEVDVDMGYHVRIFFTIVVDLSNASYMKIK
jgi:hypothetical protein